MKKPVFVLAALISSQIFMPAIFAQGEMQTMPQGQQASTQQQQEATYYLQGRPVSKERYQAAVLANEGLVLIHANNNEKAAEKLKAALALAPDLPEAHHNLGLVLAKMGDIANAAKELQEAINLNPNMESSWVTLGGLYQSQGQIDQAISTYKQFLEKFPNHAMAPRIKSLVTGLKAEKKREEQLQASAARNNDNKGNAPEQPENYYNEVTAKGVIRWLPARMPIKVYIYDGSDIPTYKPEFVGILKQSFEDWSNASDHLINFVYVDSPDKAYLICSWTDDITKFKNSAEAGETNVITDGKGIIKGTIKFLTKPLTPVLPLTENRLRSICLHEIGHSLGLAGHTTNPDDVMFYSVSFKDQVRMLGPRDAATIKMLYSNM